MNKIVFSIFIFIHISVFISTSQNTFDRISLEKQLENEKGSKYIRKAIEFGKQAMTVKDQESAFYFLRKAFDKSKNIGHSEGVAIVGLEIASILSLDTNAEKKYVDFALEMLENVISNTKDLKARSKTYEIAQIFSQINDPKLQKRANKILSTTQRDFNKRLLQKKEEEEFQEKARLEASTVRIEKEKLEDLTSTVNELKDVKQYLFSKMQQTEEVMKDMTKENIMKEALIEKKQRLIDSISFEAAIDSIIIESNNYELDKKDSELKLKESQRNLFLALAGLVLLISGFIYYRFMMARSYNKQLEEKNAIIQHEKQRSDELLLNILPEEIANELKTSGKVTAQKYTETTILFADFVNFSQISKALSPEELVKDLDDCFSKFDAITEKLGVEKIKTIGDSYMCVAGVPVKMQNHAEVIVDTAIEFVNVLNDWNEERMKKNLLTFNVRIGIHSGPVCAGVVGTKKFVFDIWGDAVNIASRMESNAEPGRINISENTYKLIKHKFKCEHRGALLTKNMGEFKMYFIEA